MPTDKFAGILKDFAKLGSGIKMSCNAEVPSTIVLSSCDSNGQCNGKNYEVSIGLSENPLSGVEVETLRSLVQVFAVE